ncbi:hypothetical protein, partial [Leptospira santarosai]|uniref:hypothetical protein n=1 Tax=Leptospira santarosai TaxID=28183 RepID=UPI0024AEA828
RLVCPKSRIHFREHSAHKKERFKDFFRVESMSKILYSVPQNLTVLYQKDKLQDSGQILIFV